METLAQTPDTDTLFDDLKRRVEELKNASVEKFEQFMNFINPSPVVETAAVAEVGAITENDFATEEAVETLDEVATEQVTTEEVTTEAPETTEELIAEAPEATVETETDPIDHVQPKDEPLENVELTASNGEVVEDTAAVEMFEENGTTPIQETELQEELDSAFIEGIGVAPKADIEIRLDEIYSIRVVANEVISSIEELQNEVADLRAQVSSMFTPEELESKVKEMVAAALRERFV